MASFPALAAAQRLEASSFPPAAIRDSCGAPLVPINNQSGALGISVQQQQQHDELGGKHGQEWKQTFLKLYCFGSIDGCFISTERDRSELVAKSTELRAA
jgi:hypothetical protein